MPGRPRQMQSKLPLLHSCPGGVRKSTIRGPWQNPQQKLRAGSGSGKQFCGSDSFVAKTARNKVPSHSPTYPLTYSLSGQKTSSDENGAPIQWGIELDTSTLPGMISPMP